MRVSLLGDGTLCKGLEGLLIDPRVGYSVGSTFATCEVTVKPGERARITGDLSDSLVRYSVECVRELAGDVLWAGPGTFTVEVPPGLEDAMLRGVLRGLMRHGKHGKGGWFRASR